MNDSASIALREFSPKDAPLLAEWKNDPEIRDSVVGYFFPTTETEELAWIQKNSSSNQNSRVVLAIRLEHAEGSRSIGMIHLSDIHWIHRTATLGLFIGDVRERGKGYGRTATLQIMEYAYQILNLRKLTLHVLESNLAAVALYKALGFVQEGCLQHHVLIQGSPKNLLVMSHWPGSDLKKTESRK